MNNLKPPPLLKQHGPFITALKALLRLFVPRPTIVGETDFPRPAIILANHKGAAGPLALSLYFPSLFVPWGHHQMTEGYARRFAYLYHVFYRQKLKKGKLASFLLAVLFALVSKLIYNGMKVIPSYPDIRIRKTLRLSCDHLDCGNSVLVFPEDSQGGYQDVPDTYHGGFAALAIQYLKYNGTDIPIIPVFYSKKDKLMAIGEAVFVGDLLKQGLTRKDITTHFAGIAQKLHQLHRQD